MRALGPSLPVLGKLADPTLELFNSNGVKFASNNNWRETQQAEIIASTVPPGNDLESAIVQTLAPSNYTAIVRGLGGATGVAPGGGLRAAVKTVIELLARATLCDWDTTRIAVAQGSRRHQPVALCAGASKQRLHPARFFPVNKRPVAV